MRKVENALFEVIKMLYNTRRMPSDSVILYLRGMGTGIREAFQLAIILYQGNWVKSNNGKIVEQRPPSQIFHKPQSYRLWCKNIFVHYI